MLFQVVPAWAEARAEPTQGWAMRVPETTAGLPALVEVEVDPAQTELVGLS